MAAHRYWRLNILTTASGAAGLFEIELRDSAGGADRTTPGGAISAQSNYPGWPASQLIDNNSGTGWAGNDGNPPPQWITYDFGAGSSYDIIELYILPRSGGLHTQAPTSLDWQYSDNGTTWTTQRSLTGLSWSSAAAQVFDVSPPPPPKFEPVSALPFVRQTLRPYHYTAWTQITGRWNLTGAVWAAGRSPVAVMRPATGGVLYGTPAADFTGTGNIRMMTMLSGFGAAAALRIAGTGTVK